jgi:hypothetical protein
MYIQKHMSDGPLSEVEYRAFLNMWLCRFIFCGKANEPTLNLLTPKFGKESDLWVQLDEESVWRKEGLLRCIRQKDLRSAICFRSAREQLS